MSYHRKKYNATRNINQEKGFECPTCNSYVPRGRDVCYNCGDMPATGANNSSSDAGGCATFFFFIFLFLAPMMYYSSKSINNSGSYELYIFILPFILIMFLSSLITLIKWNFYTGCMSVPVRLWIIAYSGLALLNFIKHFFI